MRIFLLAIMLLSFQSVASDVVTCSSGSTKTFYDGLRKIIFFASQEWPKSLRAEKAPGVLLAALLDSNGTLTLSTRPLVPAYGNSMGTIETITRNFSAIKVTGLKLCHKGETWRVTVYGDGKVYEYEFGNDYLWKKCGVKSPW